MSITFQVLGRPTRDNAVLAQVHTGSTVYYFAFDCGEDCYRGFSPSEMRAIDYLCVSHFHMDHITGFEYLFRRTYTRPERPMHVFGPPGTIDVMHHRFQGYVWNMVGRARGVWYVAEVDPPVIRTRHMRTSEGFAVAHPEPDRPADGPLVDLPHVTLHARAMEHRTPSMAYALRERPRTHVNSQALAALGEPPGPWLQAVKDMTVDGSTTLTIQGRDMSLTELRDQLLETRHGDSLAYMTDFRPTPETRDDMLALIGGCKTLICECQYLHEDQELARKNWHLTAREAAELAKMAGVEELVLFHVSKRYRLDGFSNLLDEAREIFPNTRFPETWRLP